VNKIIICILAAPLLSGCATDPYGNSTDSRTIGGMILGAAVGGLGGQAVGGDPISGAAAGMVVGGAAGYAVKGRPAYQSPTRQYYRDTQGYCYYVDQNGVSHYDQPPVRC
jgi:uncharacterized protein YcfJ